MEDINLISKRFGYLTVLALSYQCSRGKSWLCRCDCGKEVVLHTSSLVGVPSRKGDKSCGCKRYSHGGLVAKNVRTYGIWRQMKIRCYNPEADNYPRYGGKGVTVCQEWIDSFESFLEWSLNNGYADNLTLDRIERNKPYSPDNCRWVTLFVQAQNKGMRKNNKLGIKGVSPCGKYGYRVYITRDGKKVYVGYFTDVNKAAEARKAKELEYELTGTI